MIGTTNRIRPTLIKMADGRHLEKSKNHNVSTMDGQISTKCGTVMSLSPLNPLS